MLKQICDKSISDLKREGEAREFVNRIQNLRKEQKLELTDKILVKVEQNQRIRESITQFNDYICAEILAEKVEFLWEIENGTLIEVNDYQLNVNRIKKRD